MNPEQELINLKRRLTDLETLIGQIVRPSFNRYIQPIVGGPDGLKIGTAANDKLGFYGLAPAIQPSSSGESSGYTSISGTAVKSADQFSGNFGTRTYTINDLVKHLKTLGLLQKNS